MRKLMHKTEPENTYPIPDFRNYISTIRIYTCEDCGFSYYKETPHDCLAKQTEEENQS